MPYFKIGFETGFVGANEYEYIEAQTLADAEKQANEMMHEHCYAVAEEVSEEEYKEGNEE